MYVRGIHISNLSGADLVSIAEIKSKVGATHKIRVTEGVKSETNQPTAWLGLTNSRSIPGIFDESTIIVYHGIAYLALWEHEVLGQDPPDSYLDLIGHSEYNSYLAKVLGPVSRFASKYLYGWDCENINDPDCHPSYLTETVVALANSLMKKAVAGEDEQCCEILPILADALQDAGFDDDKALTEMRTEYNGMWAIKWLSDEIMKSTVMALIPEATEKKPSKKKKASK